MGTTAMHFYRPRRVSVKFRHGGHVMFTKPMWSVSGMVAVFIAGFVMGLGVGYVACVLGLPGFRNPVPEPLGGLKPFLAACAIHGKAGSPRDLRGAIRCGGWWGRLGVDVPRLESVPPPAQSLRARPQGASAPGGFVPDGAGDPNSTAPWSLGTRKVQ